MEDLYAGRTHVCHSELHESDLRVKFSVSKTGLRSPVVFGSIVHNRAIVYKRQHVLKVVVHVIIIDQCNQTAR